MKRCGVRNAGNGYQTPRKIKREHKARKKCIQRLKINMRQANRETILG